MTEPTNNEPLLTSQDIWQLFRETDRKFQATERLLKQQALDADRRAKEADRRAEEREQEAKRRAEEREQEAKRRFKEMEQLLKEQTKKMGEMNNRLGEFVESIVKPGVARLFRERNIPIHKTYPDVEAENVELGLATQIDFLVINNDCCALIEVKSKLSVDDVNDHIERMEKFKLLFPEYADKKAYAAVAAMIIPDDVAKYAYRKGFFVIAQNGESLIFLNDTKFKPKAW